jgi:hypothetical protein
LVPGLTSSHPAAHPWEWWPTLVAALLGVAVLERWAIWDAELYTLLVSQDRLVDVYNKIAIDRHPPLYFLVEWLALHMGQRDAVLRAPAAIAAVAGVGATTLAVRQVLGDGRVAGLWVATAPALVLYAGVARMYAALPLLVALLLWASWELARGARPTRAALVLAVTTGVGLYTHYAMVAPAIGAALAAAGGAWDAPDRRGRRAASAVGASLAGGLAFLPWALGPLAWQAGTTHFAGRSLRSFSYLLFAIDDYVPAMGWLWLGLGAVGALLLMRRALLFTVGWLVALLPLPYLLAGSVEFASRPYAHLGLLPLLALFVAVALDAGLRWLPQRTWLAGALVLALQLPALVEVLRLPALPFGTTDDGSADGVYDSRREVEALGMALAPGERLSLPASGLAGQYSRYGPGLVLAGPGEASATTWQLRAEAGRHVPTPATRAQEGCSFRQAFSLVLVVPTASGCDRVWSALRAADTRAPYGPFALELATRAQTEGDLEGALALAERAATNMPGAPWAEALRGRLLLDLGRPDDTIAAADRATETVIRWGAFSGLGAIERLRADAEAASGRPERAAEATARGRCIEQRPTRSDLTRCGYKRSWSW